jgi:hypothetical protein
VPYLSAEAIAYAIEYVSSGYDKPNEADQASVKVMQASEKHRLLNYVAKLILSLR